MDDNKLGRMGIEFSARVSASLSHELNNVLAVIKESSGLLQDYLAILNQGGELNPSILERVSQRLANQVNRGQKIIARMNRFAHSGDRPLAEIDLADTAGLTVDLHKRLAAQKNAEFVVEARDKVTINTNPFLVEDILWRMLCFASPLAKTSPPCPVRVTGGGGGASVAIGSLDFTEKDPAKEFPGPEENFLLTLVNASIRVDQNSGEIAMDLKGF